MKKAIISIVIVLAVLAGVWMVGTGFRREPAAFFYDYSVSDDGTVMTIHAGVAGSMGHIRKAVVRRNEDGEIRLDFLSAFGGLNGSIGARNTFEIPLEENSTSVSIYQGSGYLPVLTKDPDSGEWTMVDPKGR